MKAILVLADGKTFEGLSYGAEGETMGEVVFNTSMAGYQEVITDPSYKGQIITMTYPLIGNTGVNEEDIESSGPVASGFIVKEGSRIVSNWRSTLDFNQYLKNNNIVSIQGIDTRALTKHIRNAGAQNGIISTIDFDKKSLLVKLAKCPDMKGADMVSKVSCGKEYKWDEGGWHLDRGYAKGAKPKYKVVAYDFGIKRNILRWLVDEGCDVTVVPANTSAAKVLEMNPDGVFLSNGPGDPDAVGYAIEEVKKLIGKKPIFGICLGHQILALAMGAKTYKLKFGHRGGNQPVMDIKTGKIDITSQNHGFSVDPDTLPDCLEMTHINLNDKTVEGVKHKSLPVFSVQFHPECSPGPHDANYLFKHFTEIMESAK